ncbi:hypothetical protein B0T14DRAFT_569602 [Immersiella caudata]|uniref:Uncharacterized protein n=1 Tax=Immersiella caudata TaxID=314043 RepID=A0AA39WDV5_9PEZI|nr:hypothetical protein B0T14DRAFT_569602 [Immersiella caudata]
MTSSTARLEQKDSVQWVIHKGDMVPLPEPLRKSVKVLRRLTPTSSPVGTVTVAMSKASEEIPAKHFFQTDANFEVLNIGYIIKTVPTELRERLRSDTGVNYSRVELQVEFVVDKNNIAVELYFEEENWLPVFGGLRRADRAPTRHTLGRVSTQLSGAHT